MPAQSDGPAGSESPRPPKAPLVARLVATGAFCGYAPWSPGTAGSALGLLIALIPGVSDLLLLALTAAGFLAGSWASRLVAREEGHTLTEAAAAAKRIFQPGRALHPDPSLIVIDEIVGMWTSLLFLPREPAALIVAFVTFRLFDIVKPPPCASLERAPGGWGIMLDDLAAGAYANVVTRITLRIIA